MKWLKESRFNPSVKEFLEDHPDTTMMGLYWACWWRFIAVVYGISFIVIVFFAGLAALFE